MPLPAIAKLESLRRQHGTLAADAWFPEALADAAGFAQRRGVALDAPFTSGAGGLAFPGRDREGRRVVLKVPFAGRGEIAAMLAFSNSGVMPELIAVNEDQTAYLMEFVDTDSSVDPAAVAVRELARTLHRAAPPLTQGLGPRLARRAARAWERRYERGPAEEQSRLHLAVALGERLVETTEAPVLLHGDLHRANIIGTSRGLVAIDPAGVVGDPESEVAFYLSWGSHSRPLAEEHASVSSPRVDLWTWVWSVCESWTENGARERERLIERLEPVARAALAHHS